ncbi:DEAD/DEAH box helicase family protein [Microcoleus sp. T3_B1]|uniref:DEAD/DEAH box helicase family protein n=1 Tax=Microcoleus sp. T3_B1 TaxID=3055425 RepID=UPI002FD546BB
MQKQTDDLNQQLESVRCKIINSYLTTIEDSFLENRPQLKLINYGTGSGKTHQLFQAIYKTIQEYPKNQIIGIYVAPLREHLCVPTSVESQYPDIPVYKINSLAMKTTDEYIKLYKELISLILNNKKIGKIDRKVCTDEKLQANRRNLEKVKDVIKRLEYVKNTGLGDEDFNKSETDKAIWELNYLIESFLEFFIQCELDKSNCPAECLKLIEIFFPLHLLQNKSGILMLTYDKFETLIPYFIHNGTKWVKKSSHLDRYVIQHTDNSRKFILALDEQEDGYQIMLQKKIDIISPEKLAINNALSSINREFSMLFSTQNNENRDFLNFVDKNKGAFYEFQEHLEKDKALEEKLQKFARTYQRLTVEEGNSINFLQQIVGIKNGLDESLKEILEIFDNHDEPNHIIFNFERLSRVVSKFENNRSLLIPQKLYNKICDDLMNIFAYNNLYIYNLEPLQELFLTKPSGGHVQITEEKVADNTSVAELIYAILAVRSQIKTIKDFLANVLDAEDSQSRSLEIWSKQIAKVQKASEESPSQNQLLKYLNTTYVYESYKSIINIKEISRYQNPKNNLIDRALREVSIGSTAILTSPEFKINSMLCNNSNVIFMISATGGILGDLSTSYDMQYFKDKLRNASESGESSFKEMSEEEVSLCENIRESREAKRQIAVKFFGEDLLSFPNNETQKVVERFEETILKSFIDDLKQDGNWLGIYKIQELQKFIRFLFYLFEDDSIQETIAFTQTLRWIKKLIQHCEQRNQANFIFEVSPEHPNIYYMEVRHQKYQSNIKIKIILYEASFNSLYCDKKVPHTYLDELVEKEGEKIFFISAYQSASKGLNPIIKNPNGDEKDFDSLVLLMDSYYTVMGPSLNKSKDSGLSITLYHFALMKSIVNLGESNLEIKDFNQYLSQPEAGEFRQQQHQILLGKQVLQALGRSERRDFPNQVVKIFVNEETRKNLVNFYRYLEREEKEEIQKFSVNNHKVYLSVREEEKKRAIKDYDDHVIDEIDATLAFQAFRRQMLEEIERFHLNKHTFDIAQTWDALRDPIVFKDPAKYLEKLRDSGLFTDDFIKSLFYHHPEQVEFTPYLASDEESGKKIQIISDSINGEKIYPYQKRLYPEYLKITERGYDLESNEIGSLDPSTDLIYKLYNKLMPQPEVFNSYIPRPHFFYDVLSPSLAENFVKRWIQDVIFQGKDWKDIKSSYRFEPLQDFKKYRKLYERFDLYYVKENTLFCIDVKAWSLASGNRLSKKTLDKTENKLKEIVSDYPEFSTARGLLLNLHAAQEKNQQYSPMLFSGNLIFFDERNCPVQSNILKEFFFPKEK